MFDQRAVADATQSGLTSFFEYLPQLLGAILLVVIGYIVAKVIEGLVKRGLHAIKFDNALLSSSAGKYIHQVMNKPSNMVGTVSFWLVFLGFISLAVSALRIEALNNFIGTIYAYIPNVIAAVAIFLVAGAVSTAAVAFVTRVMGSTPLSKTIATVVPSIIMSIALFMILNQLGIAQEIVLITYTALIGAVALGLALAFGLGGRDVAGQMLQQAYEKGKQNASSVKAEIRQASARTEAEAQRVKRQTRR